MFLFKQDGIQQAKKEVACHLFILYYRFSVNCMHKVRYLVYFLYLGFKTTEIKNAKTINRISSFSLTQREALC